MTEVVLSGGDHGGRIVETKAEPGDEFDVDGWTYRRDMDDLELAVCVKPPEAPKPVGRLAAAKAAQEAAALEAAKSEG